MTDQPFYAVLDRIESRLHRRTDDPHRKVDAQSRAILLLIQHIVEKGSTTMSVIEEIEADLSALETKAESVVTSLKAKFDSEATAIAGFKQRIAALVSTIEGLDTSLAPDASAAVAAQAAGTSGVAVDHTA